MRALGTRRDPAEGRSPLPPGRVRMRASGASAELARTVALSGVAAPARVSAGPDLPVQEARAAARMVVDAELRLPTALVRLVRYDLPPFGEYVSRGDVYRVNLCLTPRPEHARICYPHHWGPHRFERIGDVHLVPPGETFMVRDDGGRQAAVVCEFEPQALHRWIEGTPRWSGCRLEAMLDIPGGFIRTLLARMSEEARHPRPETSVLAELMAGQLMIELARHYASVREGPSIGGLAPWRLHLIDQRLADLRHPPTLHELAALCGLSARQLTRGFRVSRGCSVGEFVEQRRIEAAKRLLVSGDSIKGVAFALGFSSSSSLCFAFRRVTGSTPRTFRQREAPAGR